MTGFGKEVCELNGKGISVEIRSLNSKQLDLYLRIPPKYREKELEIRTILSKKLERGKIDFTINIENSDVTADFIFNKTLAKKYFEELKSFSKEINEPETNLLPSILKMPDVLKKNEEEINDDEWNQIKLVLDKAVEEVNIFRSDEGKILAKDFSERIEIIAKLLVKIEPFEKQRIENIRNRILLSLKEITNDEKIDKDRFEQELIFYLEKLDITEEKVRLKNHCEYFLQTMKESSSGKKLGFIAQEIGREINTIGSKANDADIQKFVVQMKDELEKIKEQLLNIL